MTIRVLTDAIHADLQESLRLLFEVRLGWELYFCGGMEWYEAGIWRFEHQAHGDAVARQFLQHWPDDIMVTDIDTRPGGAITHPYTYRVDNTHPGQAMKRVTLEQAAALRPDIVLSTLAENDPGWIRFKQDGHARHFGVQVGNQDQKASYGAAEFALLSSTTPGFVPWMPHVYYHQEFDTERLFYPETRLAVPDTVRTMVQCANTSPGWGLWQAVSALMPEAEMRWYGHCGEPDQWFAGNSPNTPAVAMRMHEARVAWHWKQWSDGYGHVIHNWFAIGRPILATSAYYHDKLAGPLFHEGKTSYDITRRSAAETADLIHRLFNDEDHWLAMCEASAQRFRDVVSFSEEAAEIGRMFEGIL